MYFSPTTLHGKNLFCRIRLITFCCWGGRTKILSSPYALGALFIGLALMWVLQMRLAKEQATSFLNIVNELKGPGLTVSIGVNQPKWGRKKIYVAVSANQESIIVDAVTLEGTTVFAKGKKESTFIGKTLSEIRDSDIQEPLYDAAKMAVDALINKIVDEKKSSSVEKG